MKTTLSPLFLYLTLTLTLHLSTLAEEIDWERAQLLRQQMRGGQTLSDDDSAYLEKAMQARTGSKAPSGNATRGDGSGELATVAPVPVSEEVSPVKTVAATAADGNRIKFVYRAPKADRPLPAIVFVHGGLGEAPPRKLMDSSRSNPTQTRFLAAGYVAVAATFRTYGEEPLSRGPILDVIAIVEAVKNLPEVDPGSVIVFGTSGGGSIALELAGEPGLALPAIVIGEPATVLYTGLMTDLSMRDRSMKEYATLYTDERREQTEAKIAAISCPILVHHGDIHLLKKINFEIVFPAIEKAGKTLIVKHYPGEDHGFYWGNRTSKATVDAVIASTLEFIEPLLPSKPADR